MRIRNSIDSQRNPRRDKILELLLVLVKTVTLLSTDILSHHTLLLVLHL